MQTQDSVLRGPGWVQRFTRALLRRGRDDGGAAVAAFADASKTVVMPALDIAPNDPLIHYFQSHPSVTEIDKLHLDSPALDAMRAAGVTLAVPLVSQGELVGLVSLGPRLSEQEYSSDDRRLLDNLAGQAAPALRVAQLVRQQQAELQTRERIEQQLRLARVIQQTLLPRQVPDLPGWEITAYYQPAWEVGGDFYDFLEFPDGRLGLVIGDVTDKGVPSALVMATTRSILRSAAERLVAPTAVLARVNDLLCEEIPQNMFVTCLYVLLDPRSGQVRYANAGHDLPFRRTAGGVEELRATGMPLGLMPGMSYEEKETVVAPGETVLLYSDGLAEAHNPEREMLSFGRVREYLGARPEGTPLIDHLLGCLAAFTGAGWVQEDDVTLVSLTRLAEEGDTMSHDWRTLAEFTVASAPGNEREAIDGVAAAVRDLGLTPARLDRLMTAVGEATMNAMEHGNRYRADLPVTVVVSGSADALAVRVIDEGDAQADVPRDVPNLEAKLAGEQTPRGWGLFLIEHMVDELNQRREDGRHVTELIMYRDHERGGGHADATL